MARKPINNLWDRDMRNAIDENFKELYDEYIGAGMSASEAKQKALDALNKSTRALLNSEQTQTELDQAILSGDSSPLGGQLSVGAGNKVYSSPQERLLKENEALTSQLAQTAKVDEVFLKDVGININDFDEPTRQTFLESQGIDVNYVLGEGNVKPKNTTFFKTGKNLFDKKSATIGYVVNENTGELNPSGSYSASEYIPIEPSTSYTQNYSYYLAFYDNNKNYISGMALPETPSSPRTIQTPVNAAYIRTSIRTNVIDIYQFEKGTSATTFESYYQYIPKDLTEVRPFEISDIPLGSIGIEKTAFIKTGKNLFDKSVATLGYVVNEINGTIYANANYNASDYIAIDPLHKYTESHSYYLAFYDENKKFIKGLAASATPTQPRTLNPPPNARYIRTSIRTTYFDVYQVEKGDVKTAYEPYRLQLDESIKPKEDDFLLFLPSEICVAVGRTIEIYNNQVAWTGNIDNYHFQWRCTIGKAMKRKFSVTGVSNLIGDHSLNLTVYDNNMNVVTSGSTTLKIVPSAINTEKTILTIGDSLTNNKAWLGELRALSSDKYTMVGTRGTSPLQHEGRSGWSASMYLTTPEHNAVVNPFWDTLNQKFSWNYYKSNTGVNPDAVQVFLGTNGMTLDPTVNANNIKSIVDNIRQDDSSIPIFVVYTLYRGDQDGIGNEVPSDGYSYEPGAWSLQENRKVFNLMVRLNSLLRSYPSLHFVPISICHDSEYNFGAVETPVNPRALQVELLPSQATHPQEQGYFQMADIMFSVFAKHLSA